MPAKCFDALRILLYIHVWVIVSSLAIWNSGFEALQIERSEKIQAGMSFDQKGNYNGIRSQTHVSNL
jgi:hypothetical protein